MAKRSHYPTYNVMKEQDYWDDHTQSIVQSRLETQSGFQFLTTEEALALTAICALLTDDSRTDILHFIVSHIDHTLSDHIGESQRGTSVPQARKLIREGLAALYEHSIVTYEANFASVDPQTQKQMLEQLSSGLLQPAARWTAVPQKPFFEKVMGWAIEAYCSHPTIWSEIGYAGPAYPRGYTRTEIGQLDPWEAKSDDD